MYVISCNIVLQYSIKYCMGLQRCCLRWLHRHPVIAGDPPAAGAAAVPPGCSPPGLQTRDRALLTLSSECEAWSLLGLWHAQGSLYYVAVLIRTCREIHHCLTVLKPLSSAVGYKGAVLVLDDVAVVHQEDVGATAWLDETMLLKML